MLTANLYFAWAWILCGLLTGTVQGLAFHQEEWMGGYGSWRRRLTRLGHISFFGTGLLNIALALSAAALDLSRGAVLTSALLVLAGSIAMPPVCYLAAWKKRFRHLFFLPVVGLVTGVGLFTVEVLRVAGKGG